MVTLVLVLAKNAAATSSGVVAQGNSSADIKPALPLSPYFRFSPKNVANESCTSFVTAGWSE